MTIFVDESIPSSRPPFAGCPPCPGSCDQGRACPARFDCATAEALRHPPPDRSTAGGLEPFGDEDADGMGVFRGLAVAIALTACAVSATLIMSGLLRVFGWTS